MERMTRQTRLHAVLDELWAALERDPFVIDAMPGATNAGRANVRMRIADCGSGNESLDHSIPQSAIRNSMSGWWEFSPICWILPLIVWH
jgi:hypothetical protein